jgi:hypothetical protein
MHAQQARGEFSNEYVEKIRIEVQKEVFKIEFGGFGNAITAGGNAGSFLKWMKGRILVRGRITLETASLPSMVFVVFDELESSRWMNLDKDCVIYSNSLVTNGTEFYRKYSNKINAPFPPFSPPFGE